MPYVAPTRLYVNADRSRLVEEGDPEASFLLAAAGATVPDADVRRYGLDTPDKEPAEATEATEATEETEEDATVITTEKAPKPQASRSKG